MITTRRAIVLLAAALGLPGRIFAADAALSEGNPVTPGAPQTFMGAGGNNTSVTPGTANAALTAFEAAIGGANNGGNPPPASGGFRTINWDGVKLDGTDFTNNSVLISAGTTVGIPINRFETRGVMFDQVYAVSGDGFASVDPSNAGKFTAFSPSNVFAPFNTLNIGLRFVLASPATVVPPSAATRGFGVIFRNVRIANSTSIEYFNGVKSLGKFFAPASSLSGDSSFLGVLFTDPIITSVQITCGNTLLFGYDGITASGGPADSGTTNVVVTDDFAYAEPTIAKNAQVPITGTLGVTFTGTAGAFTDLDPNGKAQNFTATIDWGDGHDSPGKVVSNSVGGFDVQGSNTFAVAGTLPVTVQVQDLLGQQLKIHNVANVAAAPTPTPTPTPPPPTQFLNISTRAQVDSGDSVEIGGFIVGGTAPIKVLLRAIGGSLTAAGVTGALQDTVLQLYNGSGTLLATNDNWKDTQQAEIAATGVAPTDDRESAMIQTLAPGNYTGIVRGKDNSTGVALFEVYNLGPP